MKMKYSFLTFFIAAFISVYSQGPIHQWDWAREVVSSGSQVVNAVKVDTARGWVYAVGSFETKLSANFGGNISNGNKDCFVSKFDTIGNLIWSFNIGGSADDELLGLDIDNATGNIYVVGYGGNSYFSFKGKTGSDGNSTNPFYNQFSGGTDMIIACYKPNGELVWFHRDGGDGDDKGIDVSVSNGKVAYTGSFYKEMEFGGGVGEVGPSDSQNHAAVLCRNKNNGQSSWAAFTKNGNGERGVAITSNNGYFYVTGDFKGDLQFEVKSLMSYGLDAFYDDLNDSKIFYGRFRDSNGDMGKTTNNSNPWLFYIYASPQNTAGAIKVKGNKLYVGGSAGYGTFFNDSPNSAPIVGNSFFVSVHNLFNGGFISLIFEKNLSTSTTSIANSLSFTKDLLVVGGTTNGTIRFGGNSANDLIPSGPTDGFVAFYDTNNIFVETHNIESIGENSVLGLDARGEDVFVCGKFAETVNLGNTIQIIGQDQESGFLSLLSHRFCKPEFNYGFNTVCGDSLPFSVNYIADTLGVFYQLGTGLSLNVNSGKIDPFLSSPGQYSIVRETFAGCSDTVQLEIIAASLPLFTSCSLDRVVNVSTGACGAVVNYALPSFVTDCGVTVRTQLGQPGLTSGSFFPVGVTEQVFVLSDGFNLNDTCRFTITVLDNIPPTFTCPSDTLKFYNSLSSCKGLVNVSVFPKDTCGIFSLTQDVNDIVFNGDSLPVSINPYQFNFIATDNNQQQSTCKVNFYVLDSSPPVIENCPQGGDTTLYLLASENACGKTVDLSGVKGTETCNNLGVRNVYTGLPQNSFFPIDTTQIKLLSINQFNDTSTCQFNVIIVDNIAPEFVSCQASSDTVIISLSENSCTQTIQFSPPVSSHTCDTRVYHNGGISPGDVLVVGKYQAQYVAVDSSGNTATCNLKFNILDLIAPTFINCPSDTILTTDLNTCGKIFSFDPLITQDNCDISTIGINQIDQTNLNSGSVFEVGLTTLSFEQLDHSGNIGICSFTVNVLDVLKPVFNNSIPNGVCAGSDPILLYNTIDGFSSGTFQINNNGTPTQTYYPSTTRNLDSILYIYGGGNCLDTLIHKITLHDFIADAGPDTLEVCGFIVDLNATTVPQASSLWSNLGGSGVSFSPSDTISNVAASVANEGGYWVSWRVQKDACIQKDSIFLDYYKQPVADAGADFTVEESEVYLAATPIDGSGVWSVIESEGNIEDINAYNTLVTDLNAGLNVFQWTVSNGPCPLDTSLVRIFYNLFTLPNAFSPNGDGVNDVFEVQGFELHSDAKITILDRWGEVLFVSDESVKYWDGTYKGKQVVADTYFYILTLKKLEYTGYIELRR